MKSLDLFYFYNKDWEITKKPHLKDGNCSMCGSLASLKNFLSICLLMGTLMFKDMFLKLDAASSVEEPAMNDEYLGSIRLRGCL